MNLTEFTVRLIILFLPGIIAFLTIRSLTELKYKTKLDFVIHSLILGFISYSLYYLISLIPGLPSPKFIKALLDKDVDLALPEIAIVSVLSVIVGLLLSYAINHKWLNNCARFLTITNKFGDLDVWSFLMNTEDEALSWVRVRDFENGLYYEGYAAAFSDTYKDNEIFLRDVVVFNDEGQELYNTPGLYIARNPERISIEFFGMPSLMGNQEEQNE